MLVGLFATWQLMLSASAAPPGIIDAPAVEIQPIAVHQAFAERIENADQRPLRGRVLANLVEIDGLRIVMNAPGIDVVRSEFEGPAKLEVSGTLTHPFESSIRDIRFSMILVQPDQLQPVWRRLTASPLELEDHELKRALPRPWDTWSRSATDITVLTPGEQFEVDRSRSYGDIRLDKYALPSFVFTLSGYRLEDPSDEDIELIVERGGVHDLTALANWGEDLQYSHSKFDPETARTLMRKVGARLSSMRAPPAYGDLIRLHTLFVLVRMLAQPEHLEFLLSMEQPVEILLNSAGLSYHDAIDDENRLELPVHNVRQLPSLLEFMDAYKIALQDIRRESFPRLLELAYDPLDFRNTPPENQFPKSAYQQQARSLLEPFTPTSVGGIVHALAGNLDAQREVWKFYIRAHHAPAIIPMMAWLQEHPYELEEVGLLAARELGRATVPILLRYYLDPVEAEQRVLSRAMLLELKDKAANSVIAAIRSVGVIMRDDVSIKAALDAFERRELQERQIQASILETRAFAEGEDELTVSARLRAFSRLGELDEIRLQRRANEVIRYLSNAALSLDEESPVESARALDLLESLPLGARQLEALDALAMTRSRIQVNRGEDQLALDVLLDHDPDLRVHAVRRLYANIIHDWTELMIMVGRFGKAHDLLEAAQSNVPLDPRFDELRQDLFLAQYWPALILGGLFGLSLTGTSIWAAIKSYRYLQVKWPEFRRRRRRLAQRRKHAKAAEIERQRLEREAENKLEDFDPANTEYGGEADHGSDTVLSSGDSMGGLEMEDDEDELEDESLKALEAGFDPMRDDVADFDDADGDFADAPAGDDFDDLNSATDSEDSSPDNAAFEDEDLDRDAPSSTPASEEEAKDDYAELSDEEFDDEELDDDLDADATQARHEVDASSSSAASGTDEHSASVSEFDDEELDDEMAEPPPQTSERDDQDELSDDEFEDEELEDEDFEDAQTPADSAAPNTDGPTQDIDAELPDDEFEDEDEDEPDSLGSVPLNPLQGELSSDQAKTQPTPEQQSAAYEALVNEAEQSLDEEMREVEEVEIAAALEALELGEEGRDDTARPEEIEEAANDAPDTPLDATGSD